MEWRAISWTGRPTEHVNPTRPKLKHGSYTAINLLLLLKKKSICCRQHLDLLTVASSVNDGVAQMHTPSFFWIWYARAGSDQSGANACMYLYTDSFYLALANICTGMIYNVKSQSLFEYKFIKFQTPNGTGGGNPGEVWRHGQRQLNHERPLHCLSSSTLRFRSRYLGKKFCSWPVHMANR